MSKSLKLAAPLCAAALALVGCGGSGDSEGGGSPATKEGEPVEFWSAWTEGAEHEAANLEQIELFEKETGCVVNNSNFTYDMLREKVIASAAGGNLPDVVWALPEYVGEFNKLGILTDLTADWDGWADKDKVSAAVKQAMTIDGKIIGFPYEATARAYLVHDDILAEAGVSVPKTWEDVLAVGSTVEEATGSSFYGVSGAGVRSPQELVVYLA
ncbi:MAG: ABC transporter substrate-binding protein, partial [Bifidobacteriaceae bacterium]|nr:ABC transporter substrate-binding protein [Bifidobacteriaceae bacterium]